MKCTPLKQLTSPPAAGPNENNSSLPCHVAYVTGHVSRILLSSTVSATGSLTTPASIPARLGTLHLLPASTLLLVGGPWGEARSLLHDQRAAPGAAA